MPPRASASVRECEAIFADSNSAPATVGDYFFPDGRLRRSKAAAFSSKWEDENMVSYAEPTEQLRTSVKRYINTAYIIINRYLRSGQIPQQDVNGLKPEVVEEWISDLMNGIKASHLKQPTTLYRGMNFQSIAEFEKLNLRVGQVVQSKSFLSTTPVEATAKHFSTRGIPDGTYEYVEYPVKVVMEIHAPAGTNAMFIGGKRFAPSIYSPEPEVLFAPSQRLRIDSVSRSGDDIRVRATILGGSQH
jgi:hypothetical protein